MYLKVAKKIMASWFYQQEIETNRMSSTKVFEIFDDKSSTLIMVIYVALEEKLFVFIFFMSLLIFQRINFAF